MNDDLDIELENNKVQAEWLLEDDNDSDETFDEFFDDNINEDIEKKLNLQDSNIPNEFVDELKQTNKKKRKKKIVDPFIQTVKSLFSSLSARTAKYAVFNLTDKYSNCIITMSGRAKMTFEEYLLQYEPGDLGINIIYCKNDQLELLKNKFCITNIDKPILMNLEIIRKAINTALKDKEATIIPLNIAYNNENSSVYMKYKTGINEKTNEEQFTITRCAFEYKDWRTICIIKKLVDKIHEIYENKNSVHIFENYESLIEKNDQNIIVYPIDTSLYKNDNGEKIFDYIKDGHKTNLIYIQGKDIISLKEYVKKLKKEYTIELASMVYDQNNSIVYMSYFEDDEIKVLCSRPKTNAFPFITTKEEIFQ